LLIGIAGRDGVPNSPGADHQCGLSLIVAAAKALGRLTAIDFPYAFTQVFFIMSAGSAIRRPCQITRPEKIMGKKGKIPSPCIDVCKFKRAGHCIGCSMTKTQKKMFKSLKKPEHQEAFVEMLVLQQSAIGKYEHWAPAYARRCMKKGVHPKVAPLKKVG
jgi:hypothetical protein